jgi:hypothetical protein
MKKSIKTVVPINNISAETLHNMADKYDNEKNAVEYVSQICEGMRPWAASGHYTVRISDLDTKFFLMYNDRFVDAVYQELRKRGLTVKPSNTEREAYISW